MDLHPVFVQLEEKLEQDARMNNFTESQKLSVRAAAMEPIIDETCNVMTPPKSTRGFLLTTTAVRPL